MVLPLYATLEKLDPALLDASRDLGANPWTTLWRVVVPLSRSGILAGTILVFIPCVGAYLTPDLLGGGKTLMVGSLVQNQFTTARDWPFGSAVSLLLMALVLLALLAAARRKGGELL
jgi:spermidine/putrescine transport system permease protein